MKSFVKREKVALILAAVGLIISVLSLAIRLGASIPTPTPTPTPTATPTPAPKCAGELVVFDQDIPLGLDGWGRPVHLYVAESSNHEINARLNGEIEYPQGSGRFLQFTPTLALVREGQANLAWRGVKVVVWECVPGLIYRYELLSSPNQPPN